MCIRDRKWPSWNVTFQGAESASWMEVAIPNLASQSPQWPWVAILHSCFSECRLTLLDKSGHSQILPPRVQNDLVYRARPSSLLVCYAHEEGLAKVTFDWILADQSDSTTQVLGSVGGRKCYATRHICVRSRSILKPATPLPRFKINCVPIVTFARPSLCV